MREPIQQHYQYRHRSMSKDKYQRRRQHQYPVDELRHTGFLQQSGSVFGVVLPPNGLGIFMPTPAAFIRHPVLPLADLHFFIDLAVFLPCAGLVGEAIPVKPPAGQQLPKDPAADAQSRDHPHRDGCLQGGLRRKQPQRSQDSRYGQTDQNGRQDRHRFLLFLIYSMAKKAVRGIIASRPPYFHPGILTLS